MILSIIYCAYETFNDFNVLGNMTLYEIECLFFTLLLFTINLAYHPVSKNKIKPSFMTKVLLVTAVLLYCSYFKLVILCWELLAN